MPQYSRAELLAAVRADHPQLANVPDNDLFRAIAVDHPDLARGISELQEPQQRQGSGILSNIGEGLYNLTSPIHSPLQTLKGIGNEISTLATSPVQTTVDRAKAAMQQARDHGDTGAGPYIHGAIAAVPFVGQYINDRMDESTYDLPGAIAQTVTEVGVPMAGVRGAKAVNAAATPERLMGLAARAKDLRSGIGEAAKDAGRGALDMSPKRTAAGVVDTVGGAVGGIAAPVLEKVAKLKAGKPQPTNMVDRPPVSTEPSIEFAGMVDDAGAATKLPVTQADILAVERAVAPTGNARKASTLKNAPELLEVAPELRGLTPGPRFDATLNAAFKRVEQAVDAAEKTIPRETVVPKKPILERLQAIEDDYLSRNLPASVRSVQKVREAWMELPEMIPWDRFVALKRAFLEEGRSATNAAMRRAYSALMEASSQVSPELSMANRQYSIVRRALDNAQIDPVTGRRIGQVGAAPKPPVPDVKKPKPLPKLMY